MEIHRERTASGVCVLTMDDGAKNALSPDALAALEQALDEAADAPAVVLSGRPGALSAGLDLGYMKANGPDGIEELLLALGGTLLRLWTHPAPTVCAATGHAIAGGTLLALACDHAVAGETGAWGLTETQVGLEMPDFGLALARHSVRADRLEDCILPGARLDAAGAVEAGFADEVVDDGQVVARATERAEALAELPAAAYAGTKRRLRGAEADALRAGLAADVRALMATAPRL